MGNVDQTFCPKLLSTKWSLDLFFMSPRQRDGGISIYPCPSVCPSGYRYMVCSAISSYSFRATALIFCRMFIHNGIVHVHRILIFIKYSQNDRQLDLVILFVRPDIDTLLPRSIAPCFLAYRQNFRLSRFPPLYCQRFSDTKVIKPI